MQVRWRGFGKASGLCTLGLQGTILCLVCVSLGDTLPVEPGRIVSSPRNDPLLAAPRRLPGPSLAAAAPVALPRMRALRGGGTGSKLNPSRSASPGSSDSRDPETRRKEQQLRNAAVNGDLREVKELIDEGVDVNCEDYDQRTPLHLAAAENHLSILILLLKGGADAHAKDRFGHLPLDDATRGKHQDAADLLESAMQDTALLGQAKAMIFRILSSITGSSQPEQGPALKVSIARLPSFTEIAARFAKYPLPPNVEADKEKADKVQNLCEAAANGDIHELQDIVQAGTPVTSCDYDRRTALHLAAAEGHNEVIIYLLNHGADARARDRFGNLAYDDAMRGNHDESADLLLNAMTRGTLAGRARTMYTQLLSRDYVRFSPAAMGEMLSRSLHSHAIAFDTENFARGQIIEYDPAFLSVFGWFRKLKGTIFMMPVIYFQAAILLSLTIIYSRICQPTTIGNPHPTFPIFKGQAFGVSVVGGLLGFLLALFNSNGLDRWWQTRLTLGRVMAKLCDFGVMVATYVQNSEKLEECKEQRATLVRWINLVHILIYRQARNVHDISDLVHDTRYEPPRQWMTEEEWGILQGRLMTTDTGPDKIHKAFQKQCGLRGEYCAANNKPTSLFFAAQELVPVQNKLVGRSVIVLYWIERLMSQLSREGLLESSREEALFKMQECLSEIRGSILCLFTYLYCKIPYIYAHTLTCMVKLYLTVIALVAGSSLRLAESTMEKVLPLLLVCVANFAYEGIMQIHVRLWNPLGFDINAFPITKYMEFVYKTTHQLLEDDTVMLPTNIKTAPNQAIRPEHAAAPAGAPAAAATPSSAEAAQPPPASTSEAAAPPPPAAASRSTSEAPVPPPEPREAGGGRGELAATTGKSGGILLD
mmetsp:Transcript_57735/g.141624  ORF Transcript_57735/g.141624 Transcript_57735/m.141624 type:complete len:878 (+) Transcript_57735:26-2659(+)